ncbi:MAG: lytic transglycosylase domain-containing protein [Christensenellales bacterium]
MIFLLFPKKLTNEISSIASKYNLPESMIASVINIESGYDENAVSEAGAIGLMQILPSTAEDCAKRMNIEFVESDLYNKEINIEIGCYYLRYLLNMFDGNITNVLCAYNWGLGNVKNWIENGNVDNNGTITNIPVKETSDYLKKYSINNFVYKNLYGY